MSSALAMILAVGMTVPGDVPKEGMGEIEERLDLSGKWEGTCEDGEGQGWEALLVGPILYLSSTCAQVRGLWRWGQAGEQ